MTWLTASKVDAAVLTVFRSILGRAVAAQFAGPSPLTALVLIWLQHPLPLAYAHLLNLPCAEAMAHSAWPKHCIITLHHVSPQ